MTHKCPKCKTRLKQIKTITHPQYGILPVFECVECVMYWKMEEDCFKMNLTFAVASGGKIVEAEPPYAMMNLAA